jgi:hypothetical protein
LTAPVIVDRISFGFKEEEILGDLGWNFAAVIVGALVSVIVSTLFARREMMVKTRILTTLDLYKQYQSNDMVTSRNMADKILKENQARPEPLSYNELYNTLPLEEYDHIARLLHFFTQIADLHKLKYLDTKLVNETFARYFKYWHETHFHWLWQISKDKGEPPREWIEPLNYLAKQMNLTHPPSARLESKETEATPIAIDQAAKQTT